MVTVLCPLWHISKRASWFDCFLQYMSRFEVFTCSINSDFTMWLLSFNWFYHLNLFSDCMSLCHLMIGFWGKKIGDKSSFLGLLQIYALPSLLIPWTLPGLSPRLAMCHFAPKSSVELDAPKPCFKALCCQMFSWIVFQLLIRTLELIIWFLLKRNSKANTVTVNFKIVYKLYFVPGLY